MIFDQENRYFSRKVCSAASGAPAVRAELVAVEGVGGRAGGPKSDAVGRLDLTWFDSHPRPGTSAAILH
jgi:hypothetical protein